MIFSEKEVFKIMGFDRLRREGSQIEIQGLENNRLLDIGKCHGACRHAQSVCQIVSEFYSHSFLVLWYENSLLARFNITSSRDNRRSTSFI